jgi:hypothetical protein
VTKSMSKSRPAQAAGRNSRRSLDAIAGDLHRVDRQSMFEIGKLLAEARDACEHGDWKSWVVNEDNHFPWSYRTALNYIAAHELNSKYETVSHLRVPARTIYELAELAEIDGKKVLKENVNVTGVDDPAMPTIIAALKEAGRKKRLTCTEANIVISFAVLRHKWGNYPDETLDALDSIPEKAEWAEGAIDALKRAKSDKEDVAYGIVDNCRLKHLEKIYGGALPTWLNVSKLQVAFDTVEAEHRPEVRRRLMASKEPLDSDQVMDLVREVQKGAPADPELEHKPDPKPIEHKPDRKPIEHKPDPKPIEHKPDPKPIEHKPDLKPIEHKSEPKPSNLEKQLADDRKYARNFVKLNRGAAELLRMILTSQKRREAFMDALVRALKSLDGNDVDQKALDAAAEEKAA